MARPCEGASALVLSALLDSDCDHRPFPERNNAGGMWRECGARGSSGGARGSGIQSENLPRILRHSVLTRVSAGPYNASHNGAPSAIGAMTRLRSSSPMV